MQTHVTTQEAGGYQGEVCPQKLFGIYCPRCIGISRNGTSRSRKRKMRGTHPTCLRTSRQWQSFQAEAAVDNVSGARAMQATRLPLEAALPRLSVSRQWLRWSAAEKLLMQQTQHYSSHTAAFTRRTMCRVLLGSDSGPSARCRSLVPNSVGVCFVHAIGPRGSPRRGMNLPAIVVWRLVSALVD